jgi:hypothetical protein
MQRGAGAHGRHREFQLLVCVTDLADANYYAVATAKSFFGSCTLPTVYFRCSLCLRVRRGTIPSEFTHSLCSVYRVRVRRRASGT